MLPGAWHQQQHHTRIATPVADRKRTTHAPAAPDVDRDIGRRSVADPWQGDYRHFATRGIAQAREARLDAGFGIGREDVGHIRDHAGGTGREELSRLLGSDRVPGNQLERHEGADTFDHVLHTMGTGVPEMDVERYPPSEST